MRPFLAVALALAILATPRTKAADPAPAGDAAALYARAADAVKVDGPSNSNFAFPDHPPFGPTWARLARESWDANGQARALAHEARSLATARWPVGDDEALIAKLRRLSCEVADAALYQQTQADHAAAIESARDDLHLAEALERAPDKSLRHALVGAGITSQATHRFMVITSDVALTRDAKDAKALDAAAARELIKHLLDQKDATDRLVEILGPKNAPAWRDPKVGTERLIETLNRANAERTFAAMSLACHLFRFETGRWPRSLDEMSPAYLPRVPIDPWGDGKQTFGYALIKAGLPDGGDRPLVYSRCMSNDGLRYRTDAPQYGFYGGVRVQSPTGPRFLLTGQFRDVARWSRPAGADDGFGTVKPLE